MRTITRFVAAILAAIGLSAPLVAAPAASWVNFGGGINNDDGTIKYYGGNTSYAATVHGSRQTDGSVLLTEGGIEIALPSAQAQVSVMVDMSAPPASGNYDILAVDTGTYTMAARSKSRTLNLLYITNSNSTETDRTNEGRTAAWGAAERRWVTMTHQNNDNGTSIYLDDAAAAPNDTGLRWVGQSIRKVKIGAAGQKIYAIYLYTTRLTQTGIAMARMESTAALAVPLSFAFSRAGLTADGNTMEVLQVGGGAAKGSTFEATLGTNATRKTDGGGETDSSTFFKKETATPSSSLLTTNGYPMIACKFVTNADSQRVDEGWSIYLPFTPSVETTVTRVCPQLFAVNPEGGVQEDNKVFGYTVTLYSGSVDATTESPTALTTATGTTISLSGTTINTQAADFASAQTLRAGSSYTMKLAVSDSNTGGDGSYSGIAGVVFSSVIGRTVSGNADTWSTGWTGDVAPITGADVTLTVTDAATLAMDAPATLASLTVNDGSAAEVTPSLTFTGTSSLTSATTTLKVSTDVSAITASLGAVTLASGKKLTVKSLAQASSLSTSSATLETTGDTTLAAGSSLLSGVTDLIVSGGTFSSSLKATSNNSGSALATGRKITVTGSGANLLLAVGDGTGWGSAGLGIRVEKGGTLTFASRDTLKTPITLCGGTMTFRANAAHDGRAFDFYNGNGNVVTVEATKTGSVEAPTTSSITVAGTGDNAKLAIRAGTLTFDVADRAKLVVSGSLISRYNDNGTPGAVTKSGEGVLELRAANTFDTGLTISGGRVLVTGDGTLGSGVVTVNEGKTLEVQVDAATKPIANTLSGAGTVKKSGTGTLSLTGTVSTPVTVSAGTLKLGASVTSGSITVAGGRLEMSLPSSAKTVTAEGNEGTLVLILTDAQVAQENLTTQLSWTGDVSKVEVRNSNGALLSRTVSKVNESDVLVLSTGAASTRTWVSGSVSWDAGLSGFALGDNVVFGSNNASEAITVPVKTTVGTMAVNGTYAFSLLPGGLTASTITVADSAKATFTPLDVNYVRLTMANPNTAGNMPALAELQLMKGGEVVQWPRGTTIQQVNRDGTTVAPNWASGGNEAVNALIDGVWEGQATYTNPETGATGTYSGGSGNNKWWPTADPAAYAVIHLGKAIDFDGYQLRAADHNPRSPKDWSLEASADGATWAVIDSQADRTIPAAKSLYVYEGSNTIFPVAPITAVSAPIEVQQNGTLGGSAKIAGAVTFANGARLDVTAGAPTVTGAVTASGTVTVVLPEGTVLQRVLTTATTGLESAFSAEGYTFSYRDGAYWATLTAAKSLTATVTANSTTLTDLTWTRTDGVEIDAATREQLFALPEVMATLNTTTAAAVTIDCATVPALTLSGTAAVTLSAADGVTPTIASLTVAADSTVAADLLNCVTGAVTVNEGKTLSLSGMGVSLTKLPTGTGSVKIPAKSSVTYTNGDNAYSGWTTVEGELTLACELGFTEEENQQNPTYPIDIAQGGKVKLATGGSTHRSFQGEGDIEVTGDATLGIPSKASVEGGFSLKGTITVNADVTLTIAAWANNVSALSGANLCVKGTIAKSNHSEATAPTVTIANGKTLSGTGTINVPVSFADGAVLDTVTAAPLHLNGTVTGKIKVKLASGIEKTKEILVTAPSVKLDRVTQLAFADDATSQQYKTANFCFVKSIFESRHTFTVSAPLTLTSLPVSVTNSEVARNAIYAAVNHIRDSDDPVTTIKEIDAKSTNGNVLKTSSADALALFENLAAWAEPITGEGAVAGDGKVVVMYDFGISQLHVKRAALVDAEEAKLYVLLCAKVATVEGDGVVPADYAAGTTITLYQGTTPLSALEPTDEQLQDLGLTRKAGEKWFAVPMKNLDTGTNAFTVKATK